MNIVSVYIIHQSNGNWNEIIGIEFIAIESTEYTIHENRNQHDVTMSYKTDHSHSPVDASGVQLVVCEELNFFKVIGGVLIDGDVWVVV